MTDLSFRISVALDNEIKWAKEELSLEKKSDVVRKLIHFGVDYLRKAKEMIENPSITEEEKEEFRLQLEEFKKDKIDDTIFDTFSDDQLEFITFRSWKVLSQRKIKDIREKELSRMNYAMQQKDPDYHKLKQEGFDKICKELDL